MAIILGTRFFGSLARKPALSLTLLGLFACAPAKPVEPAADSAEASGSSEARGTDTPSAGTDSDCVLRDAAPTTAEECSCAGGVVHGDIGDGKVACAPDEVELGRIHQGIEGAVCCRPAAAVL